MDQWGLGSQSLSLGGRGRRRSGSWLLGWETEQGQGHPWVCCLFNLTTKPRGQEVTCSWLAGGLRSLRSGGHPLPALSLIP